MTSSTSSHSGHSAIVAISSNPAVRDRMIRALESCDCSTVEAQGGAGILAHLESTGFDFAVLDSKLPDVTVLVAAEAASKPNHHRVHTLFSIRRRLSFRMD